MVVLGAGILWFGWFGFNAGSALGANGLASSAFLATHLGAAGAMIGWLVPERIRHGKATAVGGATGAVAGLVAITPAAGFVGPLAALPIGLVGGAVCFAAVELKSRLGYDDSLDAVGVHMVGGFVGALLTGVFASLAVNPAGADGGLAPGRSPGRRGRHHAGVLVRGHLVILKLVDRLVGFRVTAEAEEAGVDLAEHGESAYAFREHGRQAIPPLEGMTEEELAEMRERLVLEATARVLEAIDARVDDPPIGPVLTGRSDRRSPRPRPAAARPSPTAPRVPLPERGPSPARRCGTRRGSIRGRPRSGGEPRR